MKIVRTNFYWRNLTHRILLQLVKTTNMHDIAVFKLDVDEDKLFLTLEIRHYLIQSNISFKISVTNIECFFKYVLF